MVIKILQFVFFFFFLTAQVPLFKNRYQGCLIIDINKNEIKK